ncbi:serine hydrolase domain-containing protein [Planomonospora venezuelensis]|uniref:CubicO group peptidase (Beta-lactamase class C family) n=1 Tax=Planomonospora venezuelensis TaxID=1999 RepID=A0A841D9U8_PLAVE|nr:CubicO group peptidase (beta-lactamase class C family) [Planomonospora venezuelensis]GIN04964.1 esterase [Planomonospora venezuelensis]
MADDEVPGSPGVRTDGWCDPRFSRVREVFDRHFADGEELGAAFAVQLDGEPVVDLWGGVADRRTGRAWERDTPVLAYSCTKAVTATAVLLLAERGLLDLAAPVADVWPGFARGGKERITTLHLLTHQAGLPAIEDPVPPEEFEDQAAIADRLARQAPIWEPGTAHGYHALTYGFLLGEVVRRVSGKTVGEITAAEIAGPAGLELWVGAPDDVAARAARLSAGERAGPGGAGRPGTGEPPAPAETDAGVPASGDGPGGGGSAAAGLPGQGPGDPLYEMARASMDAGSLMNRALGNPPIHRLAGGANHPVILRAGWPAMGAVTTARGLAGFYRELVAGRILRPETLHDAVRRRVEGPDRVLFVDSSFGLGYMRPSLTFLTPARGAGTAFGHTGMGGSLGLGDVEHGLAMAYTMNRMAGAVSGSLRAYRLAEAVYDALGR